MIDRRKFMQQVSGAVIGASTLTQRAVGEDNRPNIIYVIVDDMGYADLSCYGQKAYQTPNIDRMASEGIRFTEAYSGCTVCAPARSTLMTGLHMGHTPVRGNTGGIPLPSNAVTVASVLKKAGYTCGGFGKWGLGDLDTEGVPEKHGFDEFFGYYHQVHAHYYYPDYLIDTGKKYPLPGNQGFYDSQKNQRGGMSEKSDGKQRQFTHTLIFDRMKQFIRVNKENRFFCYAPWTPPHARYEMPESDPAWQAAKDKPWPVQAKTHAAFNLMIDRQMGELFDLLQQLGIDNNTIVFFCSDNGASNRFDGTLNSSGPFTGFKRSMNEGGIRVPLIARWPEKIKAGQTSNFPTYFPDFFPTATELAGASKQQPQDLDGLSIVPTLLGNTSQQKIHEYMYWEWPKYNWGKQIFTGNMQGVRHKKWKLLRHDHTQPWELYDLSSDIQEKQNLAAKHPDIVKQIDAWVKANRVEPDQQIEPKRPKGMRYR
jgi:arylsulfatase A